VERKAPLGSIDASKDPVLAVFGERVRTLRSRRGMTRKVLAREALISERHLANLESGVGNASVLLLSQLARALGSTIAELVGEETISSPEWLMIRRLLRGRDEESLKRVRASLGALFGVGAPAADRAGRIALIGLRGAGKSTLGKMLAADLALPFVEVDRVVQRLAGCAMSEIHSLYGNAAYRRYEARALEDTVTNLADVVIATGGGIVSEPATFELLLTHCFTIWLRASPEDHMQRVVAQGDHRPMAGNKEAMGDLKRILEGRREFYEKADVTIDTSGKTPAEAYREVRTSVVPQLPSAARTQPESVLPAFIPSHAV